MGDCEHEYWWITTPAGKTVIGPFESLDLAMRVRTYVESAVLRDDLIVCEGGPDGV